MGCVAVDILAVAWSSADLPAVAIGEAGYRALGISALFLTPAVISKPEV